jgi:hypothetical protein
MKLTDDDIEYLTAYSCAKPADYRANGRDDWPEYRLLELRSMPSYKRWQAYRRQVPEPVIDGGGRL